MERLGFQLFLLPKKTSDLKLRLTVNTAYLKMFFRTTYEKTDHI